jgi:hypothetical protein
MHRSVTAFGHCALGDGLFAVASVIVLVTLACVLAWVTVSCVMRRAQLRGPVTHLASRGAVDAQQFRERYYEGGTDILNNVGDAALSDACEVIVGSAPDGPIRYRFKAFDGMQSHPDVALNQTQCLVAGTAWGLVPHGAPDCTILQKDSGNPHFVNPMGDPEYVAGVSSDVVAGRMRCVVDLSPMQNMGEEKAQELDERLARTALERKMNLNDMLRDREVLRGRMRSIEQQHATCMAQRNECRSQRNRIQQKCRSQSSRLRPRPTPIQQALLEAPESHAMLSPWHRPSRRAWAWDQAQNVVMLAPLDNGVPDGRLSLRVWADPQVHGAANGYVALEASIQQDALRYLRHSGFVLRLDTFSSNNPDFSWRLVRKGDDGTMELHSPHGGGHVVGHDASSNRLIIVPPNDPRRASWTMTSK